MPYYINLLKDTSKNDTLSSSFLIIQIQDNKLDLQLKKLDLFEPQKFHLKSTIQFYLQAYTNLCSVVLRNTQKNLLGAIFSRTFLPKILLQILIKLSVCITFK